MTFSEKKVVDLINKEFVPVWESVAPVTVATYKLDEEREVKGTINGEIALYFCRPFRDRVLDYKAKSKGRNNKETLLTCLADLFHSIATQKKRVGTLAPKKFIARLRKEKGERSEGT